MRRRLRLYTQFPCLAKTPSGALWPCVIVDGPPRHSVRVRWARVTCSRKTGIRRARRFPTRRPQSALALTISLRPRRCPPRRRRTCSILRRRKVALAVLQRDTFVAGKHDCPVRATPILQKNVLSDKIGCSVWAPDHEFIATKTEDQFVV